MKVTMEITADMLKDKLWSGALDTLKYMTLGQAEDVLALLEEMVEAKGEVWSLTRLNDFFAFNEDFIARYLGFDDFDDLMDQSEDTLYWVMN